MKFNNKQSVTFFTLLSFWAIATSTAIAAIEPSSRNKVIIPTVVEQSEQQERQKSLEPNSKVNREILEEIRLDREWESILNDDESGEEILLANGSL